MAVQLSTTIRTAEAQAIADTAGTAGTLEVRTGSPPGVANAASGTLLATLVSVTFATASSGAVTFTATADSSGDASGTPGHVRFKTSGGTAYLEADAAVGSGSANFNATISLGGAVSLTSGTITVGNA